MESHPPRPEGLPDVIDLGRLDYEEALAIQRRRQDELIAARWGRAGSIGTIHLVEHPPIITVTSRPSAAGHVLADGARLRALGVRVLPTDRGGDVTYHGPGQIVAYPVLDLERLGHGGKPLGLHGYMRLLEQAVIDTLAEWAIEGERDPAATGVWVRRGGGGGEGGGEGGGGGGGGAASMAKIAAMGVRVRKWVTTHGLALNVDCDLSHFGLIVPCGLAGRPVTSMRALLGSNCPGLDAVKRTLAGHLLRRIDLARDARAEPGG